MFALVHLLSCERLRRQSASSGSNVCLRTHACPLARLRAACVCVRVFKGQRDTVLHITALQMAVVSGCDSESE